MKKIFVLQSKGGVGKSLLTKLLSLKADKEMCKTHFIDADNASASTTKFFRAIEGRKSEFLLYKSEHLLGVDKKIDRTKFDSFLSTIEKLENVVVDLGAATSEQLLYYIQEEQKNSILEVLKEIGVEFYLVIAGGGSIKECVEFYQDIKKIDGIGKLVKVVANEYHGGVNGKTVKEYAKADIQITSLHDDPNSEAQQEWNEALNRGIVYSDIESMPIIRRKRIISYLNSIFDQINSTNGHA